MKISNSESFLLIPFLILVQLAKSQRKDFRESTNIYSTKVSCDIYRYGSLMLQIGDTMLQPLYITGFWGNHG